MPHKPSTLNPQGGSPGVTEDKLGMTLDDVIKTQDLQRSRGSRLEGVGGLKGV